jgi:hypothetical protein
MVGFTSLTPHTDRTGGWLAGSVEKRNISDPSVECNCSYTAGSRSGSVRNLRALNSNLDRNTASSDRVFQLREENGCLYLH